MICSDPSYCRRPTTCAVACSRHNTTAEAGKLSSTPTVLVLLRKTVAEDDGDDRVANASLFNPADCCSASSWELPAVRPEQQVDPDERELHNIPPMIPIRIQRVKTEADLDQCLVTIDM